MYDRKSKYINDQEAKREQTWGLDRTLEDLALAQSQPPLLSAVEWHDEEARGVGEEVGAPGLLWEWVDFSSLASCRTCSIFHHYRWGLHIHSRAASEPVPQSPGNPWW